MLSKVRPSLSLVFLSLLCGAELAPRASAQSGARVARRPLVRGAAPPAAHAVAQPVTQHGAGNGSVGNANPQGTLEFETPQSVVLESDGSVTLRVVIGASLSQSVTIPLLIGGSATEIQDYVLAANPLVLPAGQLSVDVDVALIDDLLAEGSETLVLRLGAVTGAGLGGDDVHTLIIVDDEAAIVSDDFNTCGGLSPHWTVNDPLGDASIGVVGAGSSNAHLALSVPGGVEHQMWQTIHAPHVLQWVTDTDFRVELGFEARPAAFQIEGLFVREAADRWLRFDLYGFGGNVYAFAGSTTGTNTAQRINTLFPSGSGAFLRIERAGDTWTFEGSADGASWTILGSFNDSLTVSALGPYAGNFGGLPAFDCELDYFFDASAPIVPEDGNLAAGPAPISYVTEGQGSLTFDPPGGSYTCGDVVTITAVPASGWDFREWGGDLAGTNPVQVVTLSGATVVQASFDIQTGGGGPPVLAGVSASPGFTGATITWTTDQPATSRVDFGTTSAYGSSVSDPLLRTSHALELSGLPSGTLHHFRVQSTNAAAESTVSPDQTFTTLAGGVFASDDFNDCGGLGPQWSIDDPLGDATIELVGAGSDDAWLLMSVPAGVQHQAWNTLFAPTVTQSVPDTDFELEARFDSVPGNGQIVGLLVQQDALRWARFDFYGLNGQLYAFSGTTAGGSTTWRSNTPVSFGGPIWSRVERSGDTWTWRTSADGNNWQVQSTFTDAFSVQRAGPYVGNFGSLPAHTAAIDYVFDAAAPLAQEDGWIGGQAPSTLNVGSASGGSISALPLQAEYHCNELVTFTAQPAAGFSFAGWTGSLSGSANPSSLVMSQDRTVGATFDALVANPPVLSSISANAAMTTASISWATDVPATSRVDYGLTAALGQTLSSGAFVTQHGFQLTGLASGTTYFYSVTSVAANGAVAQSGLQQFTTDSALGGLHSDDFNDCDLDPEWTVNLGSGGGGSVGLTGSGTPDAYLEISVPAGVERQAWNSITAPHVLQPAADEDFQVELKFDSDVTSAYQMQGLLVLEDASNWVRFDVYSGPGGTRWFAGSTSGGSTSVEGDGSLNASAPHYLRVTRAGDQWTFEHSGDGSSYQTLDSFSHGLSVGSLGPYAGTALGGSSPGFTAQCDYVFDTASPIVAEDVGTPGAYTLTTTAAGGGGSVQRAPDLASYPCGAQVTLTAVPSGGFAFQGWSGAASGSANPLVVTMGADLTIDASFGVAGSAPVISNVQVAPGATTALVTWNTDQPSTSRVDYGPTAALGSTQQSSPLVTSHAVTLPSLTPGTTYQFRVSSTNAGNFTTLSATQAFATLLPGTFTSDDFRAANLDRGLWTFVDPQGAAELRLEGSGTSDARLILEVPGGVDYAAWMTNGAARVSQAVPDANLSIEAKFESEITNTDTSTGVFIAQDDDDWVRFDFYYDGNNLNLFGASFTGGTPGDLDVTQVQGSPWATNAPLYLRVTRSGNTWNSEYSYNGNNWFPGASFSHAMSVAEAGVFCGNGGTALDPQRVAVDYAFATASPIIPEDGSPGADLTEPFIYSVDSTVFSATSAQVSWLTDEPATGILEWGYLDTNYSATPVVLSSLDYQQTAALNGLLGGTTYFYRAISEDAAGNIRITPPGSFQTAGGNGADFPVIAVWYGAPDPTTGANVQRFGMNGDPQPQVNVMGNITDSDEDRVALTVTLEYRLNGGPATVLALGDDRTITYAPWRLANEGDYNVELYITDLVGVPLFGAAHRNTLELIATDDDGHQTSRTVLVDYTPGISWPQTSAIDWTSVAQQGGNVAEAIQPVDGEWEVIDDPVLGHVLRNDPAGQGYDRLVALGQVDQWDDYEILVPLTVEALDPQGFTTGTGSYAMGFAMRWQGHTPGNPYPQPNHGLYPLGCLWVYRWFPSNERWELWINENQQIISQPGNDISVGTTYWYRSRVESQAGGTTFYGFKLWADGTSEPAGWTFTHTTNPGDPATGSIALYAHHVELKVGDIQVIELP